MFSTIWYQIQIYYQIAKISQDGNHFIILDHFSNLTLGRHYAAQKAQRCIDCPSDR